MNFAQKIAKESTITFFGMVYGNINRYLYTISQMGRDRVFRNICISKFNNAYF